MSLREQASWRSEDMQRDSTISFSSNEVMQRSDALARTALALVMRGAAIRVDKREIQSGEEEAYVGDCLSHPW